MINKIIYYIFYGFRCKILKRKIPITSTLIITDKCNLKCKHCIVSNLGYKDLSFDDIKRDLKMLYDSGSRMLVITGGEPFLWKDNLYNLNDVIDYAKNIGFFRVVVCTNGTFPLVSNADYLWVSLDGFPEENDEMRNSKIFKIILDNIMKSEHKKIFINYTITSKNLKSIEEFTGFILKFKNVKGILFHLFTPYIGLENSDLRLSKEEKIIAIQKMRRLKKRFPLKISNTFEGIITLKKGNWERPVWGGIVVNNGRLSPCCCREGIYNEEVCKECGCTPAVETYVLQEFKINAILEYLRFL